jgi:hypothetical protein
VVESGGLENRCTARYRGFESLSLRHALSVGELIANGCHMERCESG